MRTVHIVCRGLCYHMIGYVGGLNWGTLLCPVLCRVWACIRAVIETSLPKAQSTPHFFPSPNALPMACFLLSTVFDPTKLPMLLAQLACERTSQMPAHNPELCYSARFHRTLVRRPNLIDALASDLGAPPPEPSPAPPQSSPPPKPPPPSPSRSRRRRRLRRCEDATRTRDSTARTPHLAPAPTHPARP